MWKKMKTIGSVTLLILVGWWAIISDGSNMAQQDWSIEIIDSNGCVGINSSIALDSNDYPHISYLDETNSDLKYAYKDNGGWHISIVDSTASVGWGITTSLALDSNDYPHISYAGDGYLYHLKYAYMDASGWHIVTVDNSTNYVGRFTSLALDSNEYPHISYEDGNADLKYAYKDNSGWHISTVDSTGYVGWYTSLALDTGGYPHISYYDTTNQDLKYAYQDSEGWHTSTVDSTGSVGRFTSIALDSNNYPHISYEDGKNVDLKYAYMDNGGWHISIADSAASVGSLSTSLVLDNDDCPHISYYSNLDLKYAYMNASVWHISTVQNLIGSLLTSLALDNDDCPHISYTGRYGFDLRYARFAPSVVYVDDDYTPSTPGYGYDHFDVIQDGIDAVAGNGIVYVCNGTYYETVVVNKTIKLIGENRNNTIIDGNFTGHTSVVNIVSDRVYLNNFLIRNSGRGWYDWGVYVTSDNNTVTGNLILNNGDGIRIEYTSNRNTITENIIINATYSGIYLRFISDNNTIKNNIITDNNFIGDTYGNGINISGNDNIVSGNVIHSNNRSGILIKNGRHNQIINCSIYNNLESGITAYTSYTNIINCSIYNNGKNGVNYSYGTHNQLINCSTYNNSGYGICIKNANQLQILNSQVYSNNERGIKIHQSNYSQIDGCIIKNHKGENINITDSSNIIIQNCIICNASWRGVVAWASDNIKILGCNILDHPNHYITKGGILLFYSENCSVTDCTITNNSCGIRIASRSNKNIVARNHLINNIYGIDTTDHLNQPSLDNFIDHNNFYGNTIHAIDPFTNFWDDGYPSGGNYWDDYTGPDNYQEPNQDIPGSDGIGDYPYRIPEGRNVDLYPLMSPFGEISERTIVRCNPLLTYNEIYAGDVFTLFIEINPAEAIAGVQFDLCFDPTLFQAGTVHEGSLFYGSTTYFSPGIVDNINGIIADVYVVITTPGDNVTHSGEAVYVNFTAPLDVNGISWFNLSNVVVGRPDGSSVPVTTINGSVTVLPNEPWDLNKDDHVNILDLILIAQHWGETGPPCWILADVNCDGIVNILDMILVGQHWTG